MLRGLSTVEPRHHQGNYVNTWVGNYVIVHIPRPRPRLSKRPPGAQAGDQLTLERTTALDEQRLVDRLVADAHGLILGEVGLQPVRDLFRAPCCRPPPVLPVRLVQPLPRRRLRSRDDRPVRPVNVPRQPLLNVLAQPVVAQKLHALRALGRLLGLPVGDRRAVLLLAAARGGVAAQLARDCPGVTPEGANQGQGREGRQPAHLHGGGGHRRGARDILGLWIGDGGEGAKYWLQVLTEIKNRGAAAVLMRTTSN